MTRTLTTLTLAALALFACKGNNDVPETGDAGQARGETQYQDSQTDTYSAPREPAEPEPQVFDIEVVLDSSADLDLSGGDCGSVLDDSVNAFLEGEAAIDDNGAYVGGLFFAEVLTPDGCTVPDAEITAVNGVTVRALLENTSENCTTYCEAKARSEAEQACAGDADEVACRTSFEASYAQDCEQTCTTRTLFIASETSLGLSQTADIGSEWISSGTVGTLETDLTFDHMVDESGDEVADDAG